MRHDVFDNGKVRFAGLEFERSLGRIWTGLARPRRKTEGGREVEAFLQDLDRDTFSFGVPAHVFLRCHVGGICVTDDTRVRFPPFFLN